MSLPFQDETGRAFFFLSSFYWLQVCFFNHFCFLFSICPQMEAKKFIILECVFSCCCFPDLCDWGVKEREREKKRKEECMWETFGFCCVRLLLSTCTLVVVVARPFGDLFFLPFFYRRTRYPPTMVHATQPSSPF